MNISVVTTQDCSVRVINIFKLYHRKYTSKMLVLRVHADQNISCRAHTQLIFTVGNFRKRLHTIVHGIIQFTSVVYGSPLHLSFI